MYKDMIASLNDKDGSPSAPTHFEGLKRFTTLPKSTANVGGVGKKCEATE